MNHLDRSEDGGRTGSEDQEGTSPAFESSGVFERPGTTDEDITATTGGGKKVRLTIEVTPQLNRVIEHIADATGSTKSEAVRKAIVLMDVAVEAKEHGDRLFVAKSVPPGTSREIVGL